MSRPVLDIQYDFDGDVIYTDAEMEGPPAKQLWATRLLVVLLAAASLYSLARGIAQHAKTSEEVRDLTFAMEAPTPALKELPSSDDLGGMEPLAACRAWAEQNVGRLAAVRLHLFSVYALMLLCPLGLGCMVVVWWRGQFRRRAGSPALDLVQLSLTAGVVVTFAAVRGFDTYTLLSQARVATVADLKTFIEHTRTARRPERLALLRERVEHSAAAVRNKTLKHEERTGAARQIYATLSRADVPELFADADREKTAALLKDTIQAVYTDEAACVPVIRGLGAMDRARGEAAWMEREKSKPSWVDVKTPAALRCLGVAIDNGDQAAVDTLIRRGADVNAPIPGEGHTPLHHAVLRKNPKLVRVLLDAKARLDVAGKVEKVEQAIEREFPLHRATGNPRMVQLLLTYGADPNALDVNGMTPLHRAAWAGDTESVELLLKKGAQVNRVDRSKRTPRDVAYELCAADKKEAVRDVLVKYGGLTAPQLMRPTSPTARTPHD